jgi:hypothetical protein
MMSFWWMADRQSPPCSRMRSGKPGRVGLEFQVRPLQIDDLGQVVERQQTFGQEDLRVVHIQGIGNELEQGRRCRVLYFQTDHRSAPAAFQGAFEQAHQIFGLLLDFQVTVPDDPEGAFAADLVAREQPVDETDRQPVRSQ